MERGDVFDGEWAVDKAHGFGVKTFGNGDEHFGLYANDRREGFGTYLWNSGDRYDGGWSDGKQEGPGGVFTRSHQIGVQRKLLSRVFAVAGSAGREWRETVEARRLEVSNLISSHLSFP